MGSGGWLNFTRCIIFGHLIRLAIWRLRGNWNSEIAVDRKLLALRRVLADLGAPESVESHLSAPRPQEQQLELQIAEKLSGSS